MNNLINIKQHEDQMVVSSREVAYNFGKHHKDVLESVRNLAAENSATKSMFIESSYQNRGKQYPEYLLTRDGFTLTVMGFTGKAALDWKLKYITAFNAMEEELLNKSKSQSFDKFMKCAEIMANCKESNKTHVVNILKHIVPDIGDVKDTRRNNTTNYMNATEVGKFFGVSARVMNVVLEEQGLQYKNEYGRWELTDFGKTYGLEISYHTKNSYGANVRWYPEVVEYLKGEKVLEK